MVTKLKQGDAYWRTIHNITGVVKRTDLISKELGVYCLIHFARADNKVIDCDIYRVSDSSPDKRVGTVGLHGGYMANYVALDMLGNDEIKDGYFATYNDAIFYLIELSEKELENHFMSLEMA
jgi:hypothetical protein